MNDYNYYQISGWMINQLGLKGIELQIYAIIYSFSQDGETEFAGSINYLCECTNCSRPTVMKSLSQLVDKGFINKKVEIINKVQFNRYSIDLQTVKNMVVKNLYGGSKETLQGGSKETLQGVVKNLYGGSKETLPNNNIYNNIYTNKDNNKEKEKDKSPARIDLNAIIESYTESKELQQALKDFLKTRKALKAPMTDRALQLCLNKLDNLGSSEAEKIAIINQSIERGWKGIFELKDKSALRSSMELREDGYYYDAKGEQYI